MAEAAVLVTSGWVASPLVKMVIDKAFDHLATGMDESRKILAATVLPRLSLAIEKAEKSPNKEKVEIWLKRLKDAYYEAEDAIDLFEYEQLKQKVKEDRKTLQQKMKHKARTRLSSSSQFVPQRLKFASDKLNNALSVFSSKRSMLINCIDKLIKIGKEADEFRDLLESQINSTSRNPDRETISQPPSKVFGREEDKDKIVKLLEEKPSYSEPGSSTKLNLPIIAILGRSGVGKTTLAQYVYKHIEKRFDHSIWLHVGQKFQAPDVIKNMIKIMKAGKGALHECNYDRNTSLEAFSKEREIELLRSKNILLVLDDIWCDTPDTQDISWDFQEQWEKFINCLGSWSPESRILLTTQSTTVKSKAHIAERTEVKTHYLHDLEENQFLELFMHHAWPSGSSMQRENFKEIGRRIAAKLKGDPGAAKVLGRQLSEKIDILHWEEIAEKDWDGDNMKARIWSYQRLPKHLQRCFTFCSLFRRGNRLPIPLLINLWIAEGFIKPKESKEILEDAFIEYLNELLSRFFLERHVNNEEDSIYLHDLFYDLAERVRGDEFITIESVNFQKNLLGNKMDNIRHIYLPASMTNKLKNRICLMKNLFTLCVEPDCIVSMKVFQEILEHSKKLRVIYIPAGVDNLPDSIGNLKHLRYLNISRSPPLKKLPDSICKLYHLQNLVPPRCESLPKNFCELISLRHCITNWETGHCISNFGRLTSLQMIGQIVIRNQAGPKLDQLENLNQLRGIISIVGLENVMNVEEAVQANIRKKEHLEELQFEWNSNERLIDDFQLLDALQPHPNIKVLAITGYKGNRFPTWLLQNSLKFLTTLCLVECTKVEEISPMDRSHPNCQFFTLRGLEKLRELPALPPNLIALEIVGNPQLSFFTQDDLLVKHGRKQSERNQSLLQASKQIIEHLKLNHTHLPKEVLLDVRGFLQFVKKRLEAAPEICTTSIPYENIFSEIDGNDCSWDQLIDALDKGMSCHLETMMNKDEELKLVLPSSLISLSIGSCNITSDALASCVQSLVFLSELKLSKIQSITSLPPEDVLCALKNLQSLTIEGCYLLCSLGGIGALTSLTELTLDKCLNLNASNGPLPSSLKNLVLRVCINVEAILARSQLPALSVLDIMTTTNQQGVLHVGHLSSLEKLTILGWSGRLEGLNSLASLHSLGFVNPFSENYFSSPVDKYTSPLKMVGVNNPVQLKLMLSDETISSIEGLGITNFGGDSLEDEVFCTLLSLKSVVFNCCKIRHLPPNMKNLPALHFMELEDCPNLCELENLPQNLLQLQIKNCPTLEENFKKDGPNYRVQFQQGSTIVTFLTEEERI